MGGANNKRQQRARRRQRNAQLERARARLEAGDLSTCEALCRALMKQHPQCVEARVIAARLGLRQGRTADALSMLQQVVAREPDCADAHFFLAQAYFDQGSFQSAATTLEPELAMPEPGARVYNLRALIDLAQGDVAAACTASAAACALDVTRLDYTLTYCEALARSGSREAARDLLHERVLARAIDDAHSWQRVANIAERLEDAALTARAWASVAQLDPKRIDHIYETGCQHFSNSDFNQAAHSFRQCWRLAPQDRRVVNALLSALRRLTPATTDALLEAELTRCLAHEGIDPNHLRDVASRQVLRKPAMLRMLELSFAQ